MEKEVEVLNRPVLFLFILMHLAALGAFFYFSFSAVMWWIIFHFLTIGFGIVIGFHRFYAHKTFEASKLFEFFFLILGTLSFQGGPLFWAAVHRAHHHKSEKYGDPHDSSRGFFWSHMKWMLYKNPNGFSMRNSNIYVKDLATKPYLVFLEKYYFAVNLTVLVIAFLAFYFSNRLDLFFWIFPFRIVTVWHCTWLVNSYAHGAGIFGKKIKNSYLLSFLTFGEGYHFNHHEQPARPHSSKSSIQIDPAYIALTLLRKVGIVRLKT